MGGEIMEYELNEVADTLDGSVDSRMALFSQEFGLTTAGDLILTVDWYNSFLIHPNGRWYKCWVNIIFFLSIYSAFFTPLEFAFFKGLPGRLVELDSMQIIFLVDIILQFFTPFRDAHTYKMVYNQRSIAQRYVKGDFCLDLLGCFPWDVIYKVTGRSELVRCLILTRLYRARKIAQFFKKMEKDIRINYLFTRIVKLITVELYCTHTAACIFYYLATTIPPEKEGYTWIGSLTLGDYKYANFREIDFWRRYVTSLYFAIVTMATVGYGEIHAVNIREMIFIMIYVSFDMILGAYLIGNMTALIVKGSNTERFRDKMADLIKYMNRNKLDREIRNQIQSHLRLQYESSYSRASILENIPVAVKAKISQSLYLEMVRRVPLFNGCSEEVLNHMVMKLNEEFFLPGEVILEQGSAVDQIYIVSHGTLEEIVIRENGLGETISKLVPYDIFGEVAVLCNIPQPYSVNVCELCRLLRMEKQSFTAILQLYFKDSQKILSNLLKGKETDLRKKQLESDINYLITKQEEELALAVNSAAHHGDLYRLKDLINAGADPNKTDYDGRTALHMAASRGYEDIVRLLIQWKADVNCIDKFGNSPLLEAVKTGHDKVAKLLMDNGAILNLEDAGSQLCKIVADSKIDLLRRLLQYGVDPNSTNYDCRTPLHIAAAEGLHLVAIVLLEFGADVLSVDRRGNTPLDEGQRCGSKPLIKILEHAKQSRTCR